jgi:hypothetical protein
VQDDFEQVRSEPRRSAGAAYLALVQEQLALKLNKAKGGVIVVDHVQPASVN